MEGLSTQLYIPCTRSAVIELIDLHDVDVSGKEAVVIGRMNFVVLPAAMLVIH